MPRWVEAEFSEEPELKKFLMLGKTLRRKSKEHSASAQDLTELRKTRHNEINIATRSFWRWREIKGGRKELLGTVQTL